MSSITQIWPQCYLAGKKANYLGISVLLNNNFECEILDVYQDKEEGNILQLIMKCNSLTINLINIYAPNKDNPNFFEKLLELTQNELATHLLICGDFNLVLDPDKDSHNYSNVNNPHARAKVLQIMSELDLVDLFREFNPEKRRFTWRRKNPVKQARLDYFLTSRTMTDLVASCSIQPSYRSDHCILEMTISISDFVTGRGTWKLNNSLLKNPDYLNMISAAIEDEKLKYCLPIYSLNYINESYNNIQFCIDDDTFLEMLFMRFRGETIRFATHLKKTQTQQEKSLIADICHLENSSGSMNQSLLDDKKSELENIRNNKINGVMTRARMQWLSEGEKPTSYFCKLESKQFTEKTIRKLQTSNGAIITDQKKILAEVEQFYANLFKKKTNTTENSCVNDNISQAKLQHISNPELGELTSPQELGQVLKKMKNNKSNHH